MAFFQHASDGHDRGTCLDSGGTGDACNQRLAELLRVAQIRVGLDERLMFHGQIIADGEATPVTPIVPEAHANRWMGAPRARNRTYLPRWSK